jgi:hypothetical protein
MSCALSWQRETGRVQKAPCSTLVVLATRMQGNATSCVTTYRYAAAVHWELFAVFGWTLPDWLSVVGFPTVILGLWLAFRQGTDAKAAADQSREAAVAARDASAAARQNAQAAKEAIERTERRLSETHLLLAIPELDRVRTELESGVMNARRRDVLRALGDWGHTATDVLAILEHTDADRHRQLISDLERSAVITGQAKNDIIAKRTDLEPGTREAREIIGVVCASAGRIVSGMKTFLRESR